MTVSTSISVVGAKEAIRSLGKIDKETRRQFTKDAQRIARPVIDEAVMQYPDELLSGMARNWKTKAGRQLFPYDRRSAVRGLKVKVDTSRRSQSVIRIVQVNPAAAIFEVAGKRNANRLAINLTAKFDRAMRLLWPIAERNQTQVQAEMNDLVMTAITRVQKELR